MFQQTKIIWCSFLLCIAVFFNIHSQKVHDDDTGETGCRDRPVSPGGPVFPALPVAPVDPLFPIGPVLPREPASPVLPATPGMPVTPSIPGNPTGPVAPVAPVPPVSPVHPVCPVNIRAQNETLMLPFQVTAVKIPIILDESHTHMVGL